MKEISRTVFLGVLFALPIIYILDNNPDQPLSIGAIAFILFLTIGAVQFATLLIGKKGDENVKS